MSVNVLEVSSGPEWDGEDIYSSWCVCVSPLH